MSRFSSILRPKYLRKYLGRELACLAGYILLALWWMWPLALRWSTHIAGGHGPLAIGDNLQFAWNFDHTARAWDSGKSALVDSNLFFPHQASLALHTMQWHHCALAALAWKLAPSTSLAAICNGLMLWTLCLNASATRLLCRHALRRVDVSNDAKREWIAWLIGAAAALGPISQARSFGHWNLLAWGYLPLLMLAVARLDEALRADAPLKTCLLRALGVSLCLALAGWCDVQFALFGGLWALAFGAASVLFGSRERIAFRVAGWTASFMGGALLLAPLLKAMLGASRDAARMAIAPQWSLDVVDLLSPSPWHPILGRLAFADVRLDGIEWIVAPGLTLLLLGFCGWRHFPRIARPWAWSAIALWMLACGPRAQIAHHPLPALAASSSTASSSAMSAREEAWERAVKLPFYWVRESVGPLKSFRVPARMSIPALACWSVCAALGLAALAASTCSAQKSPEMVLGRGRQPRCETTSAPLAWCAALMLFECWRTPLPSFDARAGRWATIIRDTKSGPQGVVPLPLAFNNWRQSWAMWGQTQHRKPLFEAYLSRAPRDLALDPVRSSALWIGLQGFDNSEAPEAKLALAYALPSPAQAARDLELWSRQGARFLLWQRGVARREDEIRVRQVLAASKRAKLVHEGPDALLWEIAPAQGTL